ncbi:MAG: hypothetical protein WCQ16_08090 [Verrucomicrobiae bacterium]
MSKKDDSNYVSVISWMWMMFVTAIPIIGLIMIFVWAFAGNNDSRKNYYRALLAWFCIFASIGILIVVIGNGPAILKHIQSSLHLS